MSILGHKFPGEKYGEYEMFRDAGKCFLHQWIESMILYIEYIWFWKSFGGLPGRGDAPEERGGAQRATPHLVWAGRMGPTSRPAAPSPLLSFLV